MKYEEFIALRESGEVPEDLSPLLQAMLLDAAGDWDAAHSLAQDALSAAGYRVHAFLHREEGDLANASYWYANAGRNMPDMSLEEEWEEISRALLGQY